jgi:hypothetical protein
LADIFSRINELNLFLQGLDVSVFSVQDKIESIMKKLQYWERCIKRNQTECFSNLHNFLIENQLKLDQNTKTNIIAHLRGLSTTFREYFSVLPDSKNWIRNPFDESTIFSSQGLSTEDTEKLTEISIDYEQKQRFKSMSVFNFWLSVRKEYPLLAGKATTRLLPFSTTYFYEKAFSSYANLKTKHRNRFNAEPDIRLYLSSVVPDYQAPCRSKQAHPSH